MRESLVSIPEIEHDSPFARHCRARINVNYTLGGILPERDDPQSLTSFLGNLQHHLEVDFGRGLTPDESLEIQAIAMDQTTRILNGEVVIPRF